MTLGLAVAVAPGFVQDGRGATFSYGPEAELLTLDTGNATLTNAHDQALPEAPSTSSASLTY